MQSPLLALYTIKKQANFIKPNKYKDLTTPVTLVFYWLIFSQTIDRELGKEKTGNQYNDAIKFKQ